jgi:hypothetical protein
MTGERSALNHHPSWRHRKVDHIAVWRLEDRLGQRQRHRVEAKIGQRLGDALAVQPS